MPENVPIAEATAAAAGQSASAESTPVAPPATDANGRRVWPGEAVFTAWAILAMGAFFRLRNYLHWRSLWLDELYIAHSIVTRGFYRLLFEPLDYWQGAPAGFLVLDRLCVDLFGAGERSLRLPSLVAGLATLPLFFFLARRLVSLRATLIAVLLFACLRPQIYYSAEVKQYSCDVAVTLAILLCAVRVWQEPKCKWNPLVYLLVGAAAIFFSHPAVFVMAGTWLVLFGLSVRANPGRAALLVAGGTVWAGLEWLNVHFFLAPLMHGDMHDGLVKDWIQLGGFPVVGPNQAAEWVWSALLKIISDYETMYVRAADLGMFVLIIAAAGLLMGKRRTVGFLLLLPLVAAIIAAFRHRYPMADRLALYLVPIFTLLLAEGVDRIWGEQSMSRSAVGGLAMVMLVGGSVFSAVYEARYPLGREETRPVYEWVRRNWRDGDVLVLSHMAEQSFDYYAPRSGLEGLEQLWPSGTSASASAGASQPLLEASAQGMAAEPWFYNAFRATRPREAPLKGYVILQPDFTTNSALYLDEIDDLVHPDPSWHWPPMQRIWFVFTHYMDASGHRVDDMCLMELDRRAQAKVQHFEQGTDGYLYEPAGQPSAYHRN